jgi:hypothetical protein
MTPSIRLSFVVLRCVAAAFAIYATARHPYGFYVTTRWVVFVTCCWGLFLSRRHIWPSFALAYVIIGAVFNPVFPFRFARDTWHNLDIAAAILLLVSLLFDHLLCRPSNQPNTPPN